MKEYKVHFMRKSTVSFVACGRYMGHIVSDTLDKRKVTCKSCKKTQAYKSY